MAHNQKHFFIDDFDLYSKNRHGLMENFIFVFGQSFRRPMPVHENLIVAGRHFIKFVHFVDIPKIILVSESLAFLLTRKKIDLS